MNIAHNRTSADQVAVPHGTPMLRKLALIQGLFYPAADIGLAGLWGYARLRT
jgi:hypothetical protein